MEQKKNRRQRRAEAKWVSNAQSLQYTTNISDEQFRLLVTRALKGELSQDEWSRITPALRKKMQRFTKKVKSTIKNTDILDQLPDDAIIKDVHLDTEKAPEINE